MPNIIEIEIEYKNINHMNTCGSLLANNQNRKNDFSKFSLLVAGTIAKVLQKYAIFKHS